jgi:DNA polymerase-1
MDEMIGFCRTHGYIKTLMGRRRYLPDITSANNTVRAQAERIAINAPMQGSPPRTSSKWPWSASISS